MAAPQLWKNPASEIEPTIKEDLLFWRRYGAAGPTDAESIERCCRNQAPGASNDAIAVGTPEVFEDYMRIGAGVSGFRTEISEPAELSIYAVTRSTDADIGVGSNDRPFVAGWHGSTSGRGSSLILYSPSSVRALAYENPAAPVIVTSNVGITASSIDRWRIYCATASAAQARIFNLTDGTSGAGATITGGKAPGLNPFAIGIPWASYLLKKLDLHAVVLYAAVHDADEQLAVATDLRLGLAQTGIVEGSA